MSWWSNVTPGRHRDPRPGSDAFVEVVVGDAADPDVTAAAADRARHRAPLAGWVNNAAVFRDVSLRDGDPVAARSPPQP